jgi:hypothetical protein
MAVPECMSALAVLLLIALVGLADAAAQSECTDYRTRHPEWLVCEDFEDYAGDFTAWLAMSPWLKEADDIDPGKITITDNESYQGAQSLYMPAAPAAGYEGSDLRWFNCDGAKQNGCRLKGLDELYIRSYVKFAPDHQMVHHFLNIGGSQPSGFWDAMGLAGCRPNGEVSAGTTVDLIADSRDSFFYTYSVDMQCDPGWSCDRYADAAEICSGCAERGLPCNAGEECCWGNEYRRTQPALLPRDRWICLEMRMKLNTPGQHDGIMAYWIDDQFIYENASMYWRTIPELQLNRASLQHYITTEDAGGHSNRVWWDNAVISTERIGCTNSTPVERCTSFDSDASGRLSDDEAMQAVWVWRADATTMPTIVEVIRKWKSCG